jgi:hypothetical protein
MKLFNKYCVSKWKNDTFETILGIGVREINKNDGGGEFNYDI